MFAWFKRRIEAARQEQLNREQMRESYSKGLLERKRKQMLAKRKQMLAKPCPIRGMDYCTSECVHYDGGNLISVRDINGERVYWHNDPVCKLWGNN